MHIYRKKTIHYFTLPREDNFQVSDGVYLRKYEPFQFFFLDEDPMYLTPPPPSTVRCTVFWYFDEIQENYSAIKVATAKNTYC